MRSACVRAGRRCAPGHLPGMIWRARRAGRLYWRPTVWNHRRAPSFGLAIALLLLAGAPRPAPAAQSSDLLTPLESVRATGDLDTMIKKRRIRVLLVYNKTFYFLDRGRQRGATYDFMHAFEDDLNRRLKTGHLRVNMVFIPVSRDELLPGLVAGRGDIAAANLTITDERREQVDFSDPIGTGVDEIVVTGPTSPAIARVEDLSGQEVFVRKSSSYYESLLQLNGELEKAGKPPVRLKLAPETLEDEDLLEMLNAGLVRLVIVDNHKAEFWAQIFPKIRLHPDAAVRTGGAIAWAFRKESPQARRGRQPIRRGESQGHGAGQPALQPVPAQREVREELPRAGRAPEIPADGGAVPQVR